MILKTFLYKNSSMTWHFLSHGSNTSFHSASTPTGPVTKLSLWPVVCGTPAKELNKHLNSCSKFTQD